MSTDSSPKGAPTRTDRSWLDPRAIRIEPNFLDTRTGNVLVSFGRTRVLCAATVEESRPRFLEKTDQGWLTAEYSLMPASTTPRARRERKKVSGRTTEIQRLIGRCLRAGIDLEKLGPRSIHIDCDVLQADGGTRTAAITGAWVAMSMATRELVDKGLVTWNPVTAQIAALSVGIVGEHVAVDLDYKEDSNAEVDMNVIMTSNGDYVEVQGTAEGAPFSRDRLNALLDGAHAGLQPIFAAQLAALER